MRTLWEMEKKYFCATEDLINEISEEDGPHSHPLDVALGIRTVNVLAECAATMKTLTVLAENHPEITTREDQEEAELAAKLSLVPAMMVKAAILLYMEALNVDIPAVLEMAKEERDKFMTISSSEICNKYFEYCENNNKKNFRN